LDLTVTVHPNKNPTYSFKAGSMSDGFFPDFKNFPFGQISFFQRSPPYSDEVSGLN